MVSSAGKYATGAEREKVCGRYSAWENMQPVLSARNYVIGAKRGKVSSRCKARESMQMVPSVRNTEQAETVKVLVSVSVGNLLVVRMVVKRDCIELRICKRKHLLWLKYFCHFRCPDGTLAKSCKGPEVLGRTGSDG